VNVSDYKVYLEKIDWVYLTTNVKSVYIHGDLQFDNIIVDDDKNFKLIDWRHEFSGLINAGDIYYDLAKLYGGTIINYAMVKNNQFGITFTENEVTLDIPNVDSIDEYRTQLKNWVSNNNLDWHKVELLVPLIYWNMAPLHTQPFNEFLWYLGLKLFAELYS
jgi:thiamine kinase-like enzyme